MIRVVNCVKGALICSVLLCVSAPVFSATVTLAGDNFDLSYDDTQPGLSLYGVPVYGGGSNNITFNQAGFGIGSTDADGTPESLSSEVVFSLTRYSNAFNFESLNLIEFGNYTLFGAGASVDVVGSLSVTALSGAFIPGPPEINSLSDMTINDSAAHNWFGSAFTDLTTEGVNAGGGLNDFTSVDTIIVRINNILQANTTQAGTSAFIQKLQAGTAIQLGINGSPASAVPVPGAVWLMGSGLLGLVGLARRKNMS